MVTFYTKVKTTSMATALAAEGRYRKTSYSLQLPLTSSLPHRRRTTPYTSEFLRYPLKSKSKRTFRSLALKASHHHASFPTTTTNKAKEAKHGMWESWKEIKTKSMVVVQFCMFVLATRFLPKLVSHGLHAWANSPTYVKVSYSEMLNRLSNDEVSHLLVTNYRYFTFQLKPGVTNPPVRRASIWELVVRNVKRPNIIVYFQSLRIHEPRRILYTAVRDEDMHAPYSYINRSEVALEYHKTLWFRIGPNIILLIIFSPIIAYVFLFVYIYGLPQMLQRILTARLSTLKPASFSTVTFSDIAGTEEVKEELQEIIEFLQNPDKYVRVGARPPHRILLVGPPGTGKSLLAKAVAGEAKVPFISFSVSELIAIYGLEAVHFVQQYFDKAAKEAPSILFIDKISREMNDGQRNVIDEILYQMDNFTSNSPVIILGATNDIDFPDPKLNQLGRFGKNVMVEVPDRMSREAILKLQISKRQLPLSSNVDLETLSAITTYFTGADLENLVNCAALRSGRANKEVVSKEDFMQAVNNQALSQKSEVRTQESEFRTGNTGKRSRSIYLEKAVVSRQEVGRAIVGTAAANLFSGLPKLQELSILPKLNAFLGFTSAPLDDEDCFFFSINELRGRLVTLLGGHIAEEMAYPRHLSAIALNDIKSASVMAYNAISQYGLSASVSSISLIALSNKMVGGTLSQTTDQGHDMDIIQKEANALLQSAMAVARIVIRFNLQVFNVLSAQLEADEKVCGDLLSDSLKLVISPIELASFMEGDHVTKDNDLQGLQNS